MGPDAMILVFWMLNEKVKPTFSLSSFTFIKRFFSSSLLSAIRVVLSACLRLLLLLPAILEQWPHKKLTQTCLWASRSLWWRHGLAVACHSVGGTECGSACIGPFEGGHYYLHYLHHSLVSGQTTGREHSSTHQQKIGVQIKPVNPKGNQSWIFIGRTDAEAETPIIGPPDAKSWLLGKDPNAGKDWRQEEKGITEDEMVGWHHRFNGHEFEQVLGVGEGQGSLACCSPWGRKVRHDWVTELNWAWPRPSEQNPVSVSVSLSHPEASISLLSLSKRAYRMKTIVTES